MAEKKIPLRMCVGCREMKPKAQLLRVVKTPQGEIILDTTGRKNGRGAYICSCSECLRRAQKSGALSRAFGETVPEDVYKTLESGVSKQ